jgi:hypothetical protein
MQIPAGACPVDCFGNHDMDACSYDDRESPSYAGTSSREDDEMRYRPLITVSSADSSSTLSRTLVLILAFLPLQHILLNSKLQW